MMTTAPAPAAIIDPAAFAKTEEMGGSATMLVLFYWIRESGATARVASEFPDPLRALLQWAAIPSPQRKTTLRGPAWRYYLLSGALPDFHFGQLLVERLPVGLLRFIHEFFPASEAVDVHQPGKGKDFAGFGIGHGQNQRCP